MRKFLIPMSIVGVLALSACSKSTAPADWAKAANTADGIVSALTLEVPLIQAAFPAMLTPDQVVKLTNADGTGLLDLAHADVLLLRAAVLNGTAGSKGAATVAQIEAYINQAMAAIGPVLSVACSASSKCASVQTAYRTTMLAVPLLELFVNNASH